VVALVLRGPQASNCDSAACIAEVGTVVAAAERVQDRRYGAKPIIPCGHDELVGTFGWSEPPGCTGPDVRSRIREARSNPSTSGHAAQAHAGLIWPAIWVLWRQRILRITTWSLAGSVLLRWSATWLAETDGALLPQPLRVNVTTSAIC
jgi:hypothetical protein